jgi:phage-related protein
VTEVPSSTAVFRAVADFASLNKELRKTRTEMELLKREAADGSSFKAFDAALNKTAVAQTKLQTNTKSLTKERRNLATAEKSLAGSIDKTTRSQKDAANSAKSYERSANSTDQAIRKLNETQKKTRQSTDSLATARNKAGSAASDAAAHVSELSKAESDAVNSAKRHITALKDEKSAAQSKWGILQKLAAGLANLAENENAASSGADNHSGALGRETSALGGATSAHRSHSDSVDRTRKSTDDATGSSDRFGDSVRRTGSSSSSSRSGIDSLESSLRRYSSSADSSSNKSVRLRGMLLGLAIPAVPAAVTLLVGAVVALGGALVGVIGAAAPAAGAIAALVPAAAAAAGAVGTVMLAFRGVKDALKEMTTVQQGAAKAAANDAAVAKQNADARVAAIRRIADAQDALRQAEQSQADTVISNDRSVAAAERDLIKSQDDVRRSLEQLDAERKQAVQDLLDIKNASIDATLSEEAAQIGLIDAQQAQIKVNADRRSSELDKRKAALAVAEAEQRLSEAQLHVTRTAEDLNTANQNGIEGAPGVVAAKQTIADANEKEKLSEQNLGDVKRQSAEQQAQANDAVVKANRNLQDALQATTDKVESETAAESKLQATMANMSPAGRAFIEYLHSLQPLITSLSQAAQTALFPGLQRALEIIMPMINSVAIPTVTAFGNVLGDLAVRGGSEIKSFEGDLLSFGTGDGPKLMDKFGTVLLNLLSAIENLMMAALPFTQWLADCAVAFSEYIKNTTSAARESGRLADFFDHVKEVLKVLGGILKNVGGILHQVFAGAAPMGMRLLKTFQDVTGATNEWMHSAEGIAAIKKYFDDMEPSIRIIFHWVALLTKSMFNLGGSHTFFDLLKQINDQLVPALQRLMKALGDVTGPLGSNFIDILSNIADMLTKLIESGGGGLSAFVFVLDTLSKVLKFILDIPGMSTLGSILLAIAGGMMALKMVGKIPGVGALGRGLNSLAGSAIAAGTGEVITKESPSTFTKGLAGAAGGAVAAPKTATARAGAVVGSGLRTLAAATPGISRFVGPGEVAATAAPVATLSPRLPVQDPLTKATTGAAPRPAGATWQAQAASAPVTLEAKGPVTVEAKGPSRVAAAAGAIGRGAKAVGGVGASIAGSIGGGLAGEAIGSKIGGDTGGLIGSVAGSIAGSFAPNVITAGLEKIGPLAAGAKAALGSVMEGFGKAAGAAGQVAVSVASAAASFIKLGIETLAANAKQLLFAAGSAIVRGAVLAWAAVQWVLNAALDANPIGLIVLAIAALVAAFIYAWTHSEKFREIVMGALQAVGDFFTWVWTTLLKPVFDMFMDGLHQLGDAATWLWNNAIKPALDAIGAAFGWAWNSLIKPVLDSLGRAFQDVGNVALWLWNNAIKPAMDGIGAAISWAYNNIIKPIFDGFMYVVHLLADSFNTAIEAIKVAWNRLGDIAKAPVNFVIDWVYNRGIVPMWNGLAGLFGLGKLAPAALLAEGGVLPGYAPGRDTIPAVLSPGEGVLVPEAVRGLGPDFVYKANEHFSRGRARADSSQRFAGGGIVGDIGGAIAGMVTDPIGSIKRLFSGVLGSVVPGSGELREAMVRIPIKVVDAIVTKAQEYASRMMAAVGFGSGGGSVEGGGTAGTERWRAVALQALGIAGQDAGNVGRLLMQMGTESGGNPTAINRQDINWQKGTPSVGLMQVIGPTYARYHNAGYNAGPFEYGVSEDPLSNILSSINYTVANYGSLARGWQGHGYAKGGIVADAFGRIPAQLSRKRNVALGRSPSLGNGRADSVPAMLTPGEFVINRKAAAVLGPDMLERLNAADLFAPVGMPTVPHFAMGGHVRAAFDSALAGRGSTYNNAVTNAGDTTNRPVVINTNVYNPTAEPASDSVASRMRTLSLLGAFSS